MYVCILYIYIYSRIITPTQQLLPVSLRALQRDAHAKHVVDRPVHLHSLAEALPCGGSCRSHAWFVSELTPSSEGTLVVISNTLWHPHPKTCIPYHPTCPSVMMVFLADEWDPQPSGAQSEFSTGKIRKGWLTGRIVWDFWVKISIGSRSLLSNKAILGWQALRAAEPSMKNPPIQKH